VIGSFVWKRGIFRIGAPLLAAGLVRADGERLRRMEGLGATFRLFDESAVSDRTAWKRTWWGWLRLFNILEFAGATDFVATAGLRDSSMRSCRPSLLPGGPTLLFRICLSSSGGQRRLAEEHTIGLRTYRVTFGYSVYRVVTSRITSNWSAGARAKAAAAGIHRYHVSEFQGHRRYP
jgi:hypothetical protein